MLYKSSAMLIASAITLGFASAQTTSSTEQPLKTVTASTNLGKRSLYFEHLSLQYRKLSEEQGRLLHQELEHPSLGSKYPTCADRARRLEEYYAEQAHKAHRESEHLKALEIRNAAVAPTK